MSSSFMATAFRSGPEFWECHAGPPGHGQPRPKTCQIVVPFLLLRSPKTGPFTIGVSAVISRRPRFGLRELPRRAMLVSLDLVRVIPQTVLYLDQGSSSETPSTGCISRGSVRLRLQKLKQELPTTRTVVSQGETQEKTGLRKRWRPPLPAGPGFQFPEVQWPRSEQVLPQSTVPRLAPSRRL